MAYRKRKQTVKRDGTDRQRDGGGEMKRERKRKRKRDQERERKMERGRERDRKRKGQRDEERDGKRQRERERGGEIGDQVTEEAETEMCHLKAKKRQLVTTRRKNLFLETLEITIVLPTSQFQNSSLQNLRE